MPEDLNTLYRRFAPELIARLTRRFGAAQLGVVEAAVQDAFVQALERWRPEQHPQSPDAWLHTVAIRRVVDQLRRRKTRGDKEDAVSAHLRTTAPDQAAPEAHLRPELGDDVLVMMFVACHPDLPTPSRLALALRTLCGFTTVEIARALLVSEPAVEKRLVRARKVLREAQVRFEHPAPAELDARLDAVLRVLYLLFSEGYAPHEGARHVREELCHEAIRLVERLLASPRTDRPSTRALAALMYLQASRLDARTDAQGELLTLAEQDRARWARPMIGRGLGHLAASAHGEDESDYHLEAGIAACHAIATRYETTHFGRIVELYDRLLARTASPVVRLNRAIAVGLAGDEDAALQEMAALASDPDFAQPMLLHAARGQVLVRRGATAQARTALKQALEHAQTPPQRRFLMRRLAGLGD
jgi:RNA polymerase sigma factor (sigma-70 family)